MTDYVVRKGGYFYRPNAAGYTVSIFEAGRWPKEEADKYAAGCDGVTVHRADEFIPIGDGLVSALKACGVDE